MTNLLRNPQFSTRKIAILAFFIYVIFPFLGSKGCFLAKPEEFFFEKSNFFSATTFDQVKKKGKNDF